MSNEVNTVKSISGTPKDGKWYSLAKEQYLRWDMIESQWDYMFIREGSKKPEYWCHLPDGTVSL